MVLDYASHPEMASAHVPPVIGTPVPSAQAATAPAPILTTPVETTPAEPAPSAPPPRPVVQAGSPLTPQELARPAQQFQQRRHHFPRH